MATLVAVVDRAEFGHCPGGLVIATVLNLDRTPAMLMLGEKAKAQRAPAGGSAPKPQPPANPSNNVLHRDLCTSAAVPQALENGCWRQGFAGIARQIDCARTCAGPSSRNGISELSLVHSPLVNVREKGACPKGAAAARVRRSKSRQKRKLAVQRLPQTPPFLGVAERSFPPP